MRTVRIAAGELLSRVSGDEVGVGRDVEGNKILKT
jgi:hypothetical protein